MSNKDQHLNPQDLHSPSPDIKSPDTISLGIKRRDFLRDSIVAATGVAVAVVAGQSISAATKTETETKTVDGAESDKKETYRLTKHIADYYKSAAI